MRSTRFAVLLLLTLSSSLAAEEGPAKGKLAKRGDHKSFEAANGLKVTVRVNIPQAEECDILFLCFFKHKEKGDTVLDVIQKLDDGLGGLIASLRNRGDFAGDERETILLTPPKGSLKAKKLMLVGLGEEDNLSARTMGRIGTVVLRESARLGAKRVAFGAAIRDQGNSKVPVGEVGEEVIRAAILAFDTEKRLEKEELTGKKPALQEFVLLAGPMYFHSVVPGAGKGVAAADAVVKARSSEPYSKKK